MVKPLVGPIIGKVTDTTSKILIEYAEDLQVEIKIINERSRQEQTQKKRLKARSPTIFQF